MGYLPGRSGPIQNRFGEQPIEEKAGWIYMDLLLSTMDGRVEYISKRMDWSSLTVQVGEKEVLKIILRMAADVDDLTMEEFCSRWFHVKGATLFSLSRDLF